MAFVYTVNKPNYNEVDLIPGTAVHYKAGTVADGNFTEGNGIVLMCTPLNLEIELFDVHIRDFVRVSVPVDDFVAGNVVMQVLTIEDGTGVEPTGAIPTDIIPPSEVTALRVEYTDTSAAFYWTNPTEADFNVLNIYRDSVLVADSVTIETITELGLASGQEYTYTFVTHDSSGNMSAGKSITFTTNAVGDTTVNLAVAS